MKNFLYIFLSLCLLSGCVSSSKMLNTQTQVDQYEQAYTKLQKDSSRLAHQVEGLLNALGYDAADAASMSADDIQLATLLSQEQQALDALQADLTMVLETVNPEQVQVYRKSGAIHIAVDNQFLMDHTTLSWEGENLLILLNEFIRSEYDLEVSITGGTTLPSFQVLQNWKERAIAVNAVASALVHNELLQNASFQTVVSAHYPEDHLEIVLTYDRSHILTFIEDNQTQTIIGTH
ncbi:MAG: hypothetical protein ACFB0B_15630 [Thermonemataceae bacterium]